MICILHGLYMSPLVEYVNVYTLINRILYVCNYSALHVYAR